MWDQFEGKNQNDAAPGSSAMKKRKIILNRQKIKTSEIYPEGKYKWPYSDSYAPKLKLIKDDMIPVKDRLYRKN